MAAKQTVPVDDQHLNGEEGERERSKIAFPYADLNNARRIAVAIHEKGGTSLSWQQLAAHLGVAVRGGGFRLMAAAAKTFGLVTYAGQGNIQLTSLGRKLCDPPNEPEARVEAFLAVPLYNQIFDKFKDHPLPGTNEGLEAEMVRLGVSKKVTDRARQIFQRSALQAGFFEYGQEKLVKPVTSTSGSGGTPAGGKDHRKDQGGGGGRSGLLQGLLDELPPERTEWAVEDRVSWLQLAAAIFERVYGKSGENIAVQLVEDSAK